RGPSGDLRAGSGSAARLGIPVRRGAGGADLERGERPGLPCNRVEAPVVASLRPAALDLLERGGARLSPNERRTSLQQHGPVRSSPGTIPTSTRETLMHRPWAEFPAWTRAEPWAAALVLGWCAIRLGRGL